MTSKVKGIVLLVFIATCFVSLSFTARREWLASAAAKPGKVSQAQARTLYMQNCARCHGEDGRGQTEQGELYGAQDLTDAKVMSKLSNKRAASVISKGGKGMPAFAKKLSKGEIDALAGFVRSFRAGR